MKAARSRILLASIVVAALAGCPKPESPGEQKPAEGAAQGEADTFYAFGASLARYAAGMKIEQKDLKAIEEGFEDALLGKKLRVDPRSQSQQMQKLVTERRAAAATEEKAAATQFLAEQAKQAGAKKLDSGVIVFTEAEGTGEMPKPSDRVKVNYTGTLRDGTEFDSSVSRGQPASFQLNRVVPCWTEALQQMKVGGKARLVCPSELAYGDRGVPGRIPAGAPLVFEVELLAIEAEPPKAADAAPGDKPKAGTAPAPNAGAKPMAKPAPAQPAKKP